MNTYFLVKAKVTHTEYIAVKASNENTAEYIAAGVITGAIDSNDKQNKDFVADVKWCDDDIDFEVEAVDLTEATEMEEAVDEFYDNLDDDFYESELDYPDDDNDGESEEFFSD